jgi:hypothetical protein
LYLVDVESRASNTKGYRFRSLLLSRALDVDIIV